MSSRAIVYRTYDPGLAELLAGLLREDGVDARVRGAHGSQAIFGAGQLVLETMVDVPGADEARAQAFVAEALAGEAARAAAAARDAEPAFERQAAMPERVSLLRALGVAPLIPGGAHLVARRHVTGIAILVGQIVALALVARGNLLEAQTGWLVAFGLFLFDLVAGGLAVRAFNRGVRVTGLRQLATAGAALLGVSLAATAAAPEVARLRAPTRHGAQDALPALRRAAAGADGALPPILRTDFLTPLR